MKHPLIQRDPARVSNAAELKVVVKREAGRKTHKSQDPDNTHDLERAFGRALCRLPPG